jgi:hypothetical protein
MAEDKIAPPFEKEVREARHFYTFQIHRGMPQLMLYLRHVWDTPQVHLQALAEMCHSVLGKLENAAKYRVTIHGTIVLKRHSNLWCLSTWKRSMPATVIVSNGSSFGPSWVYRSTWQWPYPIKNRRYFM